jgi:hypothetical protein
VGCTRSALLAAVLSSTLPPVGLPHRVPARVWVSVPTLGVDHAHLRLGRTAGGALLLEPPHDRLWRWLWRLQAPRWGERPPFPGDTLVFLPPPPRYRPVRRRWWVSRVLTLRRGQRVRGRGGLLVVRQCWGRQCTVVLARARLEGRRHEQRTDAGQRGMVTDTTYLPNAS